MPSLLATNPPRPYSPFNAPGPCPHVTHLCCYAPLSGTPRSITVCIQAPAWTSITLHCSVIFFCDGDLCGKIKFTNLLSPQLFIFNELFTLSETRGTLSCCSGLDAIQTVAVSTIGLPFIPSADITVHCLLMLSCAAYSVKPAVAGGWTGSSSEILSNLCSPAILQ